MSNKAKSQFKIESWEETPFSEDKNGPDLIRATVQQTYTGDIQGEGILEYLITTFNEDFSRFIGFERVTGTIDGHAGSFILNHDGTHEDGVAKSTFTIEPDSGTGELKGIHGNGRFEASHEECQFTMEYHFE